MDNQKKHGFDWLDKALGTRRTPKELSPDEMAAAAEGMTQSDAELQQIIEETMSENWGNEAVQEEAPVTEEYDEADEYTEDKPEAPKKKSWLQSVCAFRGSSSKENLWGIPHVISSLIWLAVIVAIGATVGRMGWLCATDVLALGKTPKELVFVIESEDDISSIAQRLKQEGMIQYPELFELFSKFTHKGDNIRTGTITFAGDIVYDYNALCNAMTRKKTSKETVEVTIPEGYSCAQIFKLMEDKGVCTAKELEEYAANGELDDYWFLKDVTRGHKYSLEGFLFPDTYEFYVGDKPGRVLEKFLDAFDRRFSDDMKEKYETLKKKLKLDLSIRDVVIMASMVEKEKADHLEGYTIASVFYNRLSHSASYPYLNSDATLIYDEEYYTGPGITAAQKQTSPYNTYTHKGLPAGPIANPGLNSLDAALDPDSTNYYYFVYDKDAGQHLFSKTLAEHQRKVKDLGL